jgi:hypothetical protein
LPDVLVVKSDAYDQVSNGEGTFRITGLPADTKYHLTAWEPNGGKTRHKVGRCVGTKDVGTLTLERADDPTLLRHSGRPYDKEYSPTRFKPSTD